MAGPSRVIDRIFRKRGLKRWARAARASQTMNLTDLRQARDDARALKTHLDALIHRAEDRLAMPNGKTTQFPRPHNADWAWRPELWRGPIDPVACAGVPNKTQFGNEVTLFHDCPLAEITARQLPNLREADLSPYGFALDVLNFEGGFLSAVIDLPQEAVAGLKRAHVLQLDIDVAAERSLEIFARLNIQNGPNTEQVAQELLQTGPRSSVEFDLAYSNLNEKRAEKAWVDLIFESPAMNRITLRDVTMSRRLRAAL